jgi:cytochrome c556
MKIRILLLTLACALVSVPAINAADKEETELGNQMDKMGGAMRKLKKSVPDAAQNAESLKLVATIKAAAVASAKEKPAWHPADAPKFQAKMKEFITKVEKLEAALKANDNATAAKICEELGVAQKEGHKEFKEDKKKK